MLRKKSSLLLLLTLIIIFSCRENIKLPPVDNNLLSEDGNFTLYVSNQSFEISRVDIQIKIDGKVVVSEYFHVGNQHNWKPFFFSLPKGTHTLEVRSNQENVNFIKQFEIKDKHWAVVNFWYYPKNHYEPIEKHFAFNISDKPIYFD